MNRLFAISFILLLLVPSTALAARLERVHDRETFDAVEDFLRDEIDDIIDEVRDNIQTGRTRTLASVESTEEDLLDEIEEFIDITKRSASSIYIDDLEDLERDLERDVEDEFEILKTHVTGKIGYTTGYTPHLNQSLYPYSNFGGFGSMYRTPNVQYFGNYGNFGGFGSFGEFGGWGGFPFGGFGANYGSSFGSGCSPVTSPFGFGGSGTVCTNYF